MDEFADGRHPAAAVEEWVFAAWTADATLGVLAGHRIVGRTAWYWAALARAGRPLLHIADFDVPVRADPFIIKGEALWAEHECVAPMEQWSVGNETYASMIDDPDEALDRAYGTPTPLAFDLEWYATGDPSAVGAGYEQAGYEQAGTVHGTIDIAGEARIELAEVPAHRWHRWSSTNPTSADAPGAPDAADALAPVRAALGPLPLPTIVAHTGVRAPFVFPDGTVDDLVLTPAGWARRRSAGSAAGA